VAVSIFLRVFNHIKNSKAVSLVPPENNNRVRNQNDLPTRVDLTAVLNPHGV
jgi:hypothetical protein